MRKINIKNFKKVVSKFATGVTVVCIHSNKTKIGKTVNSFSVLSLSPKLVLFSLDKKASALDKFKKSSYLSINILSKRQNKISDNFAKKNSNWNKISFKIGKLNTPIIDDCIANLECKKIKYISEGDHIIFICKVIYASYSKKVKPLLYFSSKYI